MSEQLEQTELLERHTENPEKQTYNNKEKDQKQNLLQARKAPPQDAIMLDFVVCQNCQDYAWCMHHDEENIQSYSLICQQLIESSIQNSICTFSQGIIPSTRSFEIIHKEVLIYSKLITNYFHIFYFT